MDRMKVDAFVAAVQRDGGGDQRARRRAEQPTRTAIAPRTEIRRENAPSARQAAGGRRKPALRDHRVIDGIGSR